LFHILTLVWQTPRRPQPFAWTAEEISRPKKRVSIAEKARPLANRPLAPPSRLRAGATGVGLATELLEGHAVLSAALDPTERFTLEVTVAEAAPRILGGLPETVAVKAARALQARGVRLVVGARVTRVRADGLETSAGDIPADLIVWAAGVKAGEINRRLGLATGRLNQFVVDDRLRASAPGVYAMGDRAEAPAPTGARCPPAPRPHLRRPPIWPGP